MSCYSISLKSLILAVINYCALLLHSREVLGYTVYSINPASSVSEWPHCGFIEGTKSEHCRCWTEFETVQNQAMPYKFALATPTAAHRAIKAMHAHKSNFLFFFHFSDVTAIFFYMKWKCLYRVFHSRLFNQNNKECLISHPSITVESYSSFLN